MLNQKFTKDKNWIHFIGVGGVATGNLAIAFGEKGYTVTGSDDKLYEPMKSKLLSSRSIRLFSGYSYKNICLRNIDYEKFSDSKDHKVPLDYFTIPGLVVAQGSIDKRNKEMLFAKRRGITIKHYAEILDEYISVPGKSIVVTGSFGKTTTTAMIVSVLNKYGPRASYLFGGISNDIDYSCRLRDKETLVSVIEGDEYMSANWDKVSKFFYYKPNILVLSGYAYDHADFFKTPGEYFDNFKNLVLQMDPNGIIIYNRDFPELQKLAKFSKVKTIGYSKDGFTGELKILGSYNEANANAAIEVLKILGLSDQKITQSLSDFRGLKRRLEIVAEIDTTKGRKITIIDDFGSTPGKSRSAIEEIKKKYNNAHIIVVFEPNLGSRQKNIASDFAGVFDNIDLVVLPPFLDIPDPNIISNKDFATYISNGSDNPNKIIILDDQTEISNLGQTIENNYLDKDCVIVFMASQSIDRKIKLVREAISSL